jgi:hypothetical protein
MTVRGVKQTERLQEVELLGGRGFMCMSAQLMLAK